MSTISPYDEALKFIRRNPGTGGASSLAKLILSLYNGDICSYSVVECFGNLDDRLRTIAFEMVHNRVERGETDDLLAAGTLIREELYPRLWELGLAMSDARRATRDKWAADESRAEREALAAAEVALFKDPAKLIPSSLAKDLLPLEDPLYASFSNRSGDWSSIYLPRDRVHSAIDQAGGAELSSNCPENGYMLALALDKRIYYVFTDYDAREAYLKATDPSRTEISRTITIPPRGAR